MDKIQENETSAGVEHKETTTEAGHTPKEAVAEAAAQGQGVSGDENLGVWETARKFKMATFVCFMVTFSAAADGYSIGMIGNIIANPGFVEQFGTETNAEGELYLASPVLSGFNAIMSIGQIIGMTGLSFLSQRFGRKAAMYAYWIFIALGVMFETIAKTWPLWLIARLCTGIGVGCMQATIPTYVSEVAPVRIRGALLMCYSVWFTVGQFFAPVALQVMSKSDEMDFRTPIYTQWSQVGLMILIYVFIPESPAWCVSRGHEARAKQALKQLHYDIDLHYHLLEINIAHERAIAREQMNEHWYAIFHGRDRLRTITAMWTLLSQQFIGLGIFTVQVAYFFEQAGLDDPFEATCIITGIGIFFSIVIVYLADVTGRRWLACGGTTLCWLCTVAVGILGVVPSNSATNKLLVFFTVLWNIGLVGNGATGWGYIGEMSSQRLRPYTAGFAAAASCVVGVGLGVLIPYMVNANQWGWGLKTGWFFAGLGLPFVAGMWWLIPETAGRSAAELDELFESKIPAWRFHKTVTATQRLVELNKTAAE
ncbi:general substrate transporter [Aspergillus germanicus]